MIHTRELVNLAAALTFLTAGFCERACATPFAPGDILVVDNFLGAVFRVDPVSGDRSILYNDSIGTGPEFSNALDILIDQHHNIYVIDSFAGLFQVDPNTGDRSLLTPATSEFNPDSAAFDGDGCITIADLGNDAVHRFDLAAGILTILSDQSHGAGVSLDRLSGVAVGADGSIILVNSFTGSDKVIRIDPVSGDRTLVADNDTGMGADFTVSKDVTQRRCRQFLDYEWRA